MTEHETQPLSRLVDSAEEIAVVGSPSSTAELSLDVRAHAVSKKLVGELALFRYLQDNRPHYAIGQIAEVTLRNIWHEDPTMRSLVRQRGRVDSVSERQDTHMADMTVSAVFAEEASGYVPSILGTAPPTGTRTCLVDDAILDEVLKPYRDELFYLGRVYGSRPRLPMWFKHFASGTAGAGEAYHIGIFGKTGSGKSVLAKMMLLAYARHDDMGVLVLDPQGEFAKDALGEGDVGQFQLPVRAVLEALGREVEVLRVSDLVLDRWDLFEQILYESPFFEQLTIPKSENRALAARVVADHLDRKGIRLADLSSRPAFDAAWTILGDETNQKVFYRSPGPLARFSQAYLDADADTFYERYWKPVAELFDEKRPGARKVNAILFRQFANNTRRPITVVDLSAEQGSGMFWNDTIQALVIDRILQGISWIAEKAYEENRTLNHLVLIDEAHRLAPREAPDSDQLKAVRNRLVDSVRTTRKYGVGWMFISQTLSSLHSQIVQQLRIFFFGFGLSMGSEFEALRQLVGGRGKALDLYQLFRDPHSSFDVAGRQYSFMTVGPVSPLSFSGTPLFFNAFNTAEDFLVANNLEHR